MQVRWFFEVWCGASLLLVVVLMIIHKVILRNGNFVVFCRSFVILVQNFRCGSKYYRAAKFKNGCSTNLVFSDEHSLLNDTQLPNSIVSYLFTSMEGTPSR